MSITIETAPDNPIICGNPAPIHVSTNNRILTPGTNASLVISCGNSKAEGDFFVLTRNGEDFRFDVKNSPSDNGFDLPEFSIDPEFTAFVDAFKDNYYIKKYYDVSITSPTAPYEMEITAKETGTINNVLITDNLNFGGGTPTAGVDDVIAQFMRAIVTLYIYKGTTWEELSVLDGGFDNENQAYIYLNEHLKSQFKSVIPNLHFPGSNVQRFHSETPWMQLKYYALIREYYGNPPYYRKATSLGSEASPNIAFDITLSNKEYPENTVSNDYTNFADGIQIVSDVKTRVSHKSAIDYFSVYVPNANNGDQVTTKVDVYYKDGNTEIALDLGYIQFTSSRDANFVTAALEHANSYATGAFDKPVKFIDVYFYQSIGGSPITSEKIRVYLNEATYEHQNHFLYKNRFGHYSSITFYENIVKMPSISQSIYQSSEYRDNNISKVYPFNTHLLDQYSTKTGLLPAIMIPQLTEFFLSEEIYYIDNGFSSDTSNPIRVILDLKSFKLPSDKQTTPVNVSFKYQTAQRTI